MQRSKAELNEMNEPGLPSAGFGVGSYENERDGSKSTVPERGSAEARGGK